MARLLITAFGTLDKDTFKETYQKVIDAFKNEKDVTLTFLNQKASQVCNVPYFDDEIKSFSEGEEIRVFPLLLNEGKELNHIKENKIKVVCEPLLISLKDEIVSYIKRHTDSDVSYALLCHGSVDNDNHFYTDLIKKDNLHFYFNFSEDNIDAGRLYTLPLMLIQGRHIEKMIKELHKKHHLIQIRTSLLNDEEFFMALINKIKEYINV